MSNSQIVSEAVAFKVQMDLKTFKKYNWQMLMKKPVFYIGPFIFLLLVFQLFLGGTPVEELGLTDFLPVVFILIVLLILVPYSINKGITKAYMSNKALQEEVLYRIDAESVFTKGDTFEHRLALSNVLKYQEHKEYILLYQSKSMAMYIPKRSLEGDKLQRLLDILAANVPSK